MHCYKIHRQILYFRELTNLFVACSRPKIWPTSRLTRLPRHATGYPWKISRWSRYAPRHQFPTKIQVDVAKEAKTYQLL